MSILALPMASPRSLKRSYADADLENAQREALPAQIAQSPYVSQAVPFTEKGNPYTDDHTNVQAVEVSQISSSARGELGAHLEPNGTVSGANSKKARQKLKQEVRQLVKDEKNRQKAEERTKKAEQRTKKELERLARDIGREEKRRAKEEQNQAKEEEKKKKDRVQHRYTS